MDRFFDSENPIMKFLTLLVDLVILNILTLVCSIPVITIGPSFTAMNYVMIHKIRGTDTYVSKMFFKSFKENLKQGIDLGIRFTVIVLIATSDLFVLRNYDMPIVTFAMISITLITIYLWAVGVYSFGLLARFENTVNQIMKNALKLSAEYFLRTLFIIFTWIVWICIILYLYKAAIVAILLFGVSLPAYVSVEIYNPIFLKLEETAPENLISYRRS